MHVLEFPLNEERVAKAVQRLNLMGPEAVSQAAFKVIEEWNTEPTPTPEPQRKLHLVSLEAL